LFFADWGEKGALIFFPPVVGKSAWVELTFVPCLQ
jgi:hypothetical protein